MHHLHLEATGTGTWVGKAFKEFCFELVVGWVSDESANNMIVVQKKRNICHWSYRWHWRHRVEVIGKVDILHLIYLRSSLPNSVQCFRQAEHRLNLLEFCWLVFFPQLLLEFEWQLNHNLPPTHSTWRGLWVEFLLEFYATRRAAGVILCYAHRVPYTIIVM